MGFIDRLKLLAGRKRKAPERDTQLYPRLMQLGQAWSQRSQMKPTPPNLRYFSRTPYARAAIRRIRDPLQSLEWEIAPKKGIKDNSELKRQIGIATECLLHPNYDDSWRSLIGQVVEDWLVFGAGVIEQQLGGDMVRPLWMWPVDAQSIQIFPAWSGDKNEARYIQTLGYSNIGSLDGRKLRNDELIYIKANDSTETPYGFGCLEIAFNTINRLLGVGDYCGNLATNAQPQTLLYMGEYSDAEIRSFRAYWRNEVEGQGITPVVGGKGKPEAIKLHPGNDDALYLKYQQFIIREVATAFGLSPMNLGIEGDVNRNTAEVGADRDWDNTIIPLAELVASYITREAIHAKLGWYQIEFKFCGLYREDEESTADIYQTYYQNNLITPNEHREKLGLPPSDDQWADKKYADVELALASARGVKQVDGSDLNKNKLNKNKTKKKKSGSPNLNENED